MSNLANLTFPITKRTQQADGSVMVAGPVTDESLDLDGQIVDAQTAAKALMDWHADHANVRQQHSPVLAPAGKGVDLKFKDGVPWLKALIVEPTAVKLVNAGVYDSFSIGIADGELDQSPAARKRAPNGILYPSLVNEVSIVDYPANVHMGKFMIAKRRKDGVVEAVGKVKVAKSLRGLDENSLVEALKSAHTGAIVHTCASAKEARKLIGTQFDARDYEAHGNVIVMKRQMDPNVGGGTDRDKIPGKDFAGPNRTYPIKIPGDVSDAAALIGKADNPDAVKAKIIAIAQRKGPEFVSELPKKWRNEMGKSQKSKKVDKAPGSKKPFPGAAPPFKSDDKSTETDEEKVARKAAKKEAKKAAKDKEPVADDDTKDDKPDTSGDNTDTKPDQDDKGDNTSDADTKATKGKKKKLSKAASRMAKEAAKAKAKAADEAAASMKRAHDALCPLYKGSVTKSLKAIVDVIDPEVFRARLMGTSDDAIESRAARKSAYDAASQIATLEMKDVNALRKVAHKAFKDAYPDVKVASPDLSDPKSFQRGFLPSANKETATSTSKPGNFPDAKPLKAEQFTRGPLTTNQARPSLMGGESMAVKGRTFYTNDARDKNADAMGILHDHIAENYPSVCPAGSGLADESTDRLGTAPEMYSAPSPTITINTKDSSTLSAVAVKRATEDALKPFLKKNKKQAKAIKSLKRRVRKELAQPDYTKSAHRRTDFAAITGGAAVTEITEKKKERLERAKMLSSRIHDRNSATLHDDIEEIQGLVSAKEFGVLMTSDVD